MIKNWDDHLKWLIAAYRYECEHKIGIMYKARFIEEMRIWQKANGIKVVDNRCTK